MHWLKLQQLLRMKVRLMQIPTKHQRKEVKQNRMIKRNSPAHGLF
jgi:hypothetical protein